MQCNAMPACPAPWPPPAAAHAPPHLHDARVVPGDDLCRVEDEVGGLQLQLVAGIPRRKRQRCPRLRLHASKTGWAGGRGSCVSHAGQPTAQHRQQHGMAWPAPYHMPSRGTYSIHTHEVMLLPTMPTSIHRHATHPPWQRCPAQPMHPRPALATGQATGISGAGECHQCEGMLAQMRQVEGLTL